MRLFGAPSPSFRGKQKKGMPANPRARQRNRGQHSVGYARDREYTCHIRRSCPRKRGPRGQTHRPQRKLGPRLRGDERRERMAQTEGRQMTAEQRLAEIAKVFETIRQSEDGMPISDNAY